ncbi:MAG TPA: prolyl oligopeptidase family serine peptidase [Vicinamibacterales bacterium]|nr:prolyl oligopeptidase family serine peptidase [Vicinamibacterales bacterium]
MLARFFSRWERRLYERTTGRRVRPFEWGLDWLGLDRPGDRRPAAEILGEWALAAQACSTDFFAAPPTDDYRWQASEGPEAGTVTFPSAVRTPHPCNDLVSGRLFRVERRGDGRQDRRRAVVVLPQWNADWNGHVGLCRLLARFGVNALRLSLPYHDRRMPPELSRADYIVSSNLGQTLHVCRQAVVDARRAVAWLEREGFERIGILGTSLGSCLAMLTTAHEPRIRAQALNHVSLYFADVIWEGLSTEHVRRGLDGYVTLDRLREWWMPISPAAYVRRVKGTPTLLVSARYDTTFPLHLSMALVEACRREGVDFELTLLPCGHYTTGLAPFKYLDGWALVKFLRKRL